MKPLRFNYVVPAFWVTTIGLAVILLAKGAKSAIYGDRFPDHAMFMLIFLIVICWVVTGPRELAAFRCFRRNVKRLAAMSFAYIRVYSRRAARSLAALFTTPSYNRPQTEP